MTDIKDDNVDLLADANNIAPTTLQKAEGKDEPSNDTEVNTLLDSIKDETLKESATAQKFKDVDSVIKSYEELQKKLGARIQDLSADDLKSLDKKFDVPNSIDGYDFEEVENDTVSTLRNTMLEAGISKNQAEKLDKLVRENLDTVAKTDNYNEKLSLDESRKELEAHFGLAYKDKINLANEAMHEVADEEQRAYFKKNKFTSDPEFIKTMVKVGEVIGEDKLEFKSKTREFSLTPNDVGTKIQTMIKEHGVSKIVNDPNLNKEWKHLHSLKAQYQNLRG